MLHTPFVAMGHPITLDNASTLPQPNPKPIYGDIKTNHCATGKGVEGIPRITRQRAERRRARRQASQYQRSLSEDPAATYALTVGVCQTEKNLADTNQPRALLSTPLAACTPALRSRSESLHFGNRKDRRPLGVLPSAAAR